MNTLDINNSNETMLENCIFIAHPAPFIAVKDEAEDILGVEIKIHPKNNQVAYFSEDKNFIIEDIQTKLSDIDVIILDEKTLVEYF